MFYFVVYVKVKVDYEFNMILCFGEIKNKVVDGFRWCLLFFVFYVWIGRIELIYYGWWGRKKW